MPGRPTTGPARSSACFLYGQNTVESPCPKVVHAQLLATGSTVSIRVQKSVKNRAGSHGMPCGPVGSRTVLQNFGSYTGPVNTPWASCDHSIRSVCGVLSSIRNYTNTDVWEMYGLRKGPARVTHGSCTGSLIARMVPRTMPLRAPYRSRRVFWLAFAITWSKYRRHTPQTRRNPVGHVTTNIAEIKFLTDFPRVTDPYGPLSLTGP